MKDYVREVSGAFTNYNNFFRKEGGERERWRYNKDEVRIGDWEQRSWARNGDILVEMRDKTEDRGRT